MFGRATEHSGAYDLQIFNPLYGTNRFVIEKNSFRFFPTGVRVTIPHGYCGLIKTRSSTQNEGLQVFPGVIDSDYDREIYVGITNVLPINVDLDEGRRYAQMVIVPCIQHPVEYQDAYDKPPPSKMMKIRDGGFGSTGTTTH